MPFPRRVDIVFQKVELDQAMLAVLLEDPVYIHQ